MDPQGERASLAPPLDPPMQVDIFKRVNSTYLASFRNTGMEIKPPNNGTGFPVE